MNMTFFFVALLTACPGQELAPQTGIQSNDASIANQFAEVERQVQTFRSSWVARAVTEGPDGKLVPMMGPNEKLMTLGSVVTELDLDCLGKKALWEQLTQLAPGQVVMTPACQVVVANNQAIAEAQMSYLRSLDLLCKANDQLAKVKSEQAVRDREMAAYIRLIEARDTLRLKLAEEQEAPELARLRGMTLDELKAAVSRTGAALERAQQAHLNAVSALNEAVERSNQGSAVTSSTQPDFEPAGE